MDGIAPAVGSGSVISLLLIILASMVYGLWKAFLTGAVCTAREMREKNARIEAQAQTIATLEHQLDLVLTEAMKVINPVLNAMRAAAEADET